MSDAWTDPLLPPAQTRLEAALGRSMPPVGLTPELIATLWNPATIPAPLLPWLAWALSVDEWDRSWSEATQRAVCAASFPIHKKKGTVWAVRSALENAGCRSQLTEWWQDAPRGVPHTFRIDVEIDDRGLDETTLAAVSKNIDSVKPVRSHYTLRMLGRSVSKPYVACATLSGDIVSISPYQIGLAVAPQAAMTIGIGVHDQSAVTLYPRMN